ncbi:MAG: FIVAR domain-containing protein, partial [Limosilactobacillus sp.]|uniref:beta strand repeat-containing protein n=1 Tax=Limosilactobacillus sp. TaxID=2773925 RepID=UPI0023C1FC58
MVSKNNKKLIAEKNRRNEKQRFAIRKLNIGVASVLLGITFSIYGGGQAVAHADTTNANASDQVAASNMDDNSLADKSAVALSSAAANASQSSTSATSANSAVQSQASANSQPAATASNNAPASTSAVEATKDQSTSENQSSTSQEVQTPAPAQPVGQENSSKDANASLDATRQVLNTITNRNSMPGANYLTSFAAVPASSNVAALNVTAEAEDPNVVTVSDADGLINAIQKGTATTINIDADINLGTKTTSNYTNTSISNKRDITIQSATPGTKHTIDFAGYGFNMYSSDYGVTFKDLNLYGQSYFGIVRSAGSYTFDNVNYTGSQLVYTDSGYSATVTFKNTVNATSVASYVGPIDKKTRSAQGNNGNQQVLQFRNGTNSIVFDEGSNVHLKTVNSNVIEIDGGTTTIDVKTGSNVTLEPHTTTGPESNFMNVNGIGRGIASSGTTTLNIEKDATLNIPLTMDSGDKCLSSALDLNSGATINNNGTLKITSDGSPYYRSDGWDDPVYINGNASINVGNGANFILESTNLDSYSGHLMTISGTGTVKLAPHSNFKISGDGTGAVTAINLSSGSTFTSDQPDSFNIDLSKNTNDSKALIKNGTINFSRVKTVATDGITSDPLGKIDVTYDGSGNVKSYIITAQDENTVKQVADGLTNKSLISLVQAGEDVTLSNLHLSKNNVLTGTVASSGSDNPIYVTVTIGGVSTNVPVVGNYTVYTNTNGTVTSDNVDYAAQTASTGGNFSIDLSKLASSLTDDAQVAVTATKDFVESSQTESVAALRALNTTTLQELVDAAPEEEKKASYYNATEEAQKAYTDAISTGKDILANPNNYDQVDVDDAVTAIQNAQKALTGEPTNKTELQDAINQASTVESSDNYTNADADLQKAYTDAISAGQTVLSNDSATQTEVDDALTKINTAKEALNGDTKKAASKEALQKAVSEASTIRTDDAAYYNGSNEAKTAYDNAISAGQAVLDNSNATATQITDALNAINTAKGNLKGEATNKSVLQKVVDNSATVKDSNNYTNADETQKTAYDSAVTAAQTVLNKTNATQAEVDNAVKAITDAINGLNGDTNLANAKNVATEDIQKALNTKTTEITDATNIDQATKDQLIADAKKAAEDANTAINQATNADAVNTAKTEGITNINNVTV